MSTELRRVEQAARKVTTDRAALRDAIVAAKAAGASIRAIATAAGLSVGSVHAIIKENPS